jgi:hypothetical protein
MEPSSSEIGPSVVADGHPPGIYLLLNNRNIDYIIAAVRCTSDSASDSGRPIFRGRLISDSIPVGVLIYTRDDV